MTSVFRSRLTRFGALGLLALLVGLVAPRVRAFDDCNSGSVTITEPAENAVGLDGIVRIQYTKSLPSGYYWAYPDGVLILDSNQNLVEYGYGTSTGPTSGYYDLDTRLHASGNYILVVGNQLTGPEGDCPNYTISPDRHVSFATLGYARHTTQWHLGLLGATGGAELHGTSVHPMTGFLSFGIPLTTWEYKGRTNSFGLEYTSGALVDPTSILPHDFSGLSEKLTHWHHPYASWVDLWQDETGNIEAVWHGGSKVTAFPRTEDGFASPDSAHTLTFGGTAESPSYFWAGGSQTTVVPYGWFIVEDTTTGTKYEYNYEPPSGQTHLFWQTADGVAYPHYLLSRVRDRWGRVINVTWSSGSDPRVTSAKDAGNTGVTLGYTGSTLTSVTDPQGRTHSLSYTAVPDETGTNRQKLTGVTVYGLGSPNRTLSAWSFVYRDAANPDLAYGGNSGNYSGDLVIQRSLPTGETSNYRYYAADDKRTGRLSRISWLDNSEGTTVEKVVTRVPNGMTGTVTLPGNISTQYTYGQGLTQTTIYEPATDRLWQYNQDSAHNLVEVRTPAERNTTNPLTQIEYVYDDAHRVDKETLRTRQDDGSLGDPVETQYNDLNLPTQVTRFARAGSGNVDQITRYEYDGGELTIGNLTNTIEAYGTAVQRETTNFYEGTAGAAGLVTRTANPVGGESAFEYHSERGWLLSNASPANLVVGATHPDRPSSVRSTAYNGDGVPSQTTDPEGHVVQITYNAASSGSPNLVTTRTFADGSYTQVTTDALGRTLETRDEKGVRTQWTYNSEGKVKSVRRAVGTSDERLTVNYYDERGDLVATDPPAGSSGRIQFEYFRYNQDGTLATSGGNPIYEGKLTRILHADGTDEKRGYNAAGDIAWVRRADGSVVTMTYDAAHRLTAINYPAHGSQAAYSLTSVYDEFGRVVSQADRTGTTTTTFDALNRPLLVTPPSPQKAISYSYTPDTVLHRWTTTMTVAGVGSYEYREDSKGRICQVINPFSQSFSHEFDKDSKCTLTIHPNGVREERSYTGRDWLGGLLYRKADGSVLDTFSYYYTDNLGVYDPSGRLQREVDAGGRTHSFLYNNLSELIGESHPDIGTVSYAYDMNGNRSSKTTSLGTDYYHVDAANKLQWVNRGTNAAPTSGQSTPYTLFSYDANGCITQRERRYDGGLLKTLDFIWDGDNRLRQVKEGATTRFSADYRGDGLRVGKWDSWSGQHDYTWGPNGIMFDSSGNTVLTPGLAQRSNGVDRFSHADWIGSARYLTDSTGNAAPSALRFDAFGERTALAGPAYPTEFQFGAKSGYQTEYQDASDPGLGIVYCQQRYYDPAAGRFVSPDPIGFADGVNRYAYVGNNPVAAKDPTGTARDPLYYYPNQAHGVRRLEFELFIPAPVVKVDIGPFSSGTFEGDGRGPQSDGGSYRIRHSVFLYADGSAFAPEPKTGETHNLDTGERKYASNDGLETYVQYRDGGWDVIFRGTSRDPLVWYAPFLQYDLRFRVTDDGVWFVDGAGTIFPAMELWSYADGVDPSLKWILDARKDSSGPVDLFKGLYDFRTKEGPLLQPVLPGYHYPR